MSVAVFAVIIWFFSSGVQNEYVHTWDSDWLFFIVILCGGKLENAQQYRPMFIFIYIHMIELKSFFFCFAIYK